LQGDGFEAQSPAARPSLWKSHREVFLLICPPILQVGSLNSQQGLRPCNLKSHGCSSPKLLNFKFASLPLLSNPWIPQVHAQPGPSHPPQPVLDGYPTSWFRSPPLKMIIKFFQFRQNSRGICQRPISLNLCGVSCYAIRSTCK